MNTARIVAPTARITARTAWIALRDALRKIHHLGRREALCDRMHADLARLAETAPHLLPDIGLPAPERSAEAPPRHLRGRGV
jgi:hypothetical protein